MSALGKATWIPVLVWPLGLVLLWPAIGAPGHHEPNPVAIFLLGFGLLALATGICARWQALADRDPALARVVLWAVPTAYGLGKLLRRG